MAFYRFQLRDPVQPVDGPGHDGASLADDIEATVFAAGIIQRMLLERPDLPSTWVLAISQDGREVNDLTIEAGCRFMLHWNGLAPASERESDVVLGAATTRLRP